MIRLDANPYNRVLLCTKPKNTTSKKKRPVGDKKQKAQSTSSYSDEVLEYYSGEEVKQIYKWIEDGVAAIRNYADSKDTDF